MAATAPASATAPANAPATAPSDAPPAPSPPAFPVAASVLVLVAHPTLEHSRINRRWLEAIRRADTPPRRVMVRDLYALYPDYLIDVQAEQAALRDAQLVVWQHPIHWYAMPPLMKLWLDEVLTFGWAYGPGGSALQGKLLWLVASTGSAEAAYQPAGHNRHAFAAFLPPYEQTATLCGMRFVRPLVLHGAQQLSEAALLEHAARYAERLRAYPDWPELVDPLVCPDCSVPELARPAAGAARSGERALHEPSA